MSNKRILIPVILAVLALLAWVAASFFGFVYTDVNLILCILFALGILILMGFGLYFLLQTNDRNNDMKAGRKRLLRSIAWIMYIAGSVVSVYFLNHYFKVWADQKAEVRTEALAQIEELKTTFSEDESLPNSFMNYIARRKDNMDRILRGEGLELNDRRIAIANLEKKLRGYQVDPENANSTFDLTKDEVNKELSGFESAVKSWNPFKVTAVLKELSAKKAEWEDYAAKFQDVDPDSEKDPFILKSDHNEELAGLITNTGFSTNWQAILSAILLQVLMLLPVLLTTRFGSEGKAYKPFDTI